MDKEEKPNEISKFKSFYTSLLNNLVVSILVILIIWLFSFLFTDFRKIVYEVPEKISSIDSVLKVTISKIDRFNYKEGYKPIQSGVVFNKDNKNPIPNEQVTLIKHKNNPIENIDKIKGKYIVLKSSNRENPVWTRLLITRISENPKDIEREVDIFVNDETAKILTPNPNVGIFTLEYKLEAEEQNR